ncbi:DUF2939 domain-containing protein [Variovorax sp. J22P168]|uniref:DUF2939 domain-containing protein n=1 Tax=Variovorax jilinensis TaxID=3053513 RepID=UPI002574FB96|nr:DUF2939 domain-containing protein [Variovorax sp. J22P168]MDM0013463.1 DUF2939 domain-containing protein [Variovorax sp. J22P168]
MTKTRRIAAATVLAALLLALGAYWYWSPLLAVRELQSAAQQGDAERFNAHVDYTKLRESFKGQFAARLAQKLGTPKDGDALSALGSMIGLGLINQLVDAMVRPETVMAAMQSGSLGNARSRRGDAAVPVPSTPPATPPDAAAGPQSAPSAPPATPEPAPDAAKSRWVIDRQGASRMTAYAVDPARPNEPDADRLGLVFERSGFADWKLTDIRLPASTFRR